MAHWKRPGNSPALRYSEAIVNRLNTARLTVFVSAFLLFALQPLVARAVLPLLGGSAQVWNTCVLFFQVTLLFGYGYAHLSVKHLSHTKQALAHGIITLLALLTLPFCFNELSIPPPDTFPLWWLLENLLLIVAPSLCIVSSTAPLVTRWYGEMDDEESSDPYFLYSASNVGSILALLAYPFLIEPTLGLQEQMRLWALGYLLLLFLQVGNVYFLLRATRRKNEEEETVAINAGTKSKLFRWLLLSALPASLLLSITNHMTCALPPVPLMWIVPLLIYLLAFVMAFSRRQLISVKLISLFMPLCLSLLALIMFVPTRTCAFLFQLFALFVCSFFCIGQLRNERPPKSQSTYFYLCLATGGVLGSTFNAIVAPLLFPVAIEYGVVLVLMALLCPKMEEIEEDSARKKDLYYPLLLGGVTYSILRYLPRTETEMDIYGPLSLLLIVAAIALYFRHRPLRFALSLAVVAGGGFYAFQWGNIYLGRSYYGTYRVVQEGHSNRYVLFSGTTIQGKQDKRDSHKNLYCYHAKGPIGTILKMASMKQIGTIGAIGLGVGALANYGRLGQEIVFFEICPLVKKIALNENLFTYIKNSKAKVRIVLGDGRVSISREKSNRFDLIVLDAFSGNAIPVHLLTKEAIKLYFDKLKSHGLCLIHVSNRHLDIAPLLARLANELSIVGVLLKDKDLEQKDEEEGAFAIFLGIARTK